MTSKFQHIYGPVYSWRLGMSLGIDPLSTDKKVCNFDCVYCQLGKTKEFTNERKIFVATNDILDEIQVLPYIPLDYLTISGRGEPTLAKNLGEVIMGLREIRDEKIAVITNSSLLDREDVRADLLLADYVIAKLDVYSQETLESIDGAMAEYKFRKIIKGIMEFHEVFKGRLALQIMFVEHNKKDAARLAKLASIIDPHEVQLNTPMRPSGVRFLSVQEMEEIRQHFKGLPVSCVYDAELKNVEPLNKKDTIRRHGYFKKRF